MYTGIDVLIIVVVTMMATVVATIVMFSCAIANGLDEKIEKAYWKGFSDGKKVGRYES